MKLIMESDVDGFSRLLGVSELYEFVSNKLWPDLTLGCDSEDADTFTHVPVVGKFSQLLSLFV